MAQTRKLKHTRSHLNAIERVGALVSLGCWLSRAKRAPGVAILVSIRAIVCMCVSRERESARESCKAFAAAAAAALVIGAAMAALGWRAVPTQLAPNNAYRWPRREFKVLTVSKAHDLARLRAANSGEAKETERSARGPAGSLGLACRPRSVALF